MKMNIGAYIAGVVLSIAIISCDRKTLVIAIKNKMPYVISGASLIDDSLTDKELYDNRIDMNILLNPGQSQEVGVLSFKFGVPTDTSKLYLYVFHDDSLKKCLQQKNKDILARSLIKKTVIQLNKLKKLDTIYVK